MARTTREQAMTTLFTGFQAAVSAVNWKTITRRLSLWGDVPAGEQPYLCMAEHGEEYIPVKPGDPRVLCLNVLFVMYITAPDSTTPCSPIVNDLMEAIDTFFVADGTHGRFTLGGLVYRCWIEGKVFKDPGDIDGQGMITVPVRILVP